MKNVIIVVPLYKESISYEENISLNQLKKILGSYEICFICPEGLNSDCFGEFRVERFDNSCFVSVNSYSRLMLSEYFYSRFADYEYMLIYQLDAFVFSDRLKEFCGYEYDYIGAPWLTGISESTKDGYRYENVGNGGFSLRNVKTCLNIIHIHKRELENYNYPEDMFFAFQNGEKFKTAPIEVALQFSFEREVRECYRVNHNRLPFGCHAWETHDVLFWQPIFKEFGYDISNLVSVGNKDFTCRKEFADRKKEEAFWSKRGKLCLDNDSNRKLLIWGTGKYGKRMFDILKKSNVEISGFVDNDEEKCGKIKYGLEIYPPTIVGGDSQYFIIVAIAGNGGNAVKEQLLKMGKVYVTDYVLYNDAVCLRECVD